MLIRSDHFNVFFFFFFCEKTYFGSCPFTYLTFDRVMQGSLANRLICTVLFKIFYHLKTLQKLQYKWAQDPQKLIPGMDYRIILWLSLPGLLIILSQSITLISSMHSQHSLVRPGVPFIACRPICKHICNSQYCLVKWEPDYLWI